MIAVLGIEAIGDDAKYRAMRRGSTIGFKDLLARGSRGRAQVHEMIRYEERPRAWVARITGNDQKYGLAREFLRFKRDYAESNSIGSRGVYQWYELEEGALFEVNAPLSWKHADRYFCRSERGRVVRMTREEIDAAIVARTMVEIATVTL